MNNRLSRSIPEIHTSMLLERQATNKQQQHKNRKHRSSQSSSRGKSSRYQDTGSSFTADDSSIAGDWAKISPRIVQPAWDSPRGSDMDHLVGLVIKASASREVDQGSISACAVGISTTNNLNIDTPVATLSGAWRNNVSAGTGRTDVRIP